MLRLMVAFSQGRSEVVQLGVKSMSKEQSSTFEEKTDIPCKISPMLTQNAYIST